MLSHSTAPPQNRISYWSRPRADAELQTADHLLLVINVIGLGLAGADALLDLGAWSAYACVLFTSTLYLGFVIWRRSELLIRLLIFGLGAGLAELAADWWLVSITETLHYAKWGPFLVDSPSYMPLCWAGIVLSMGFLGWTVAKRHGTALGMLAATVASGVYVPAYEALAHYAEWWTYDNCSMWGPVPWYIIIGEALIGLALTPTLKLVLHTKSRLLMLAAGAGVGLWIGVAYFIGLALS